TDVKPVLDAVAARAAKICEATDARILLVDGEQLRNTGGFGDVPVITAAFPLNRASASGRAVLDRAPVQIADVQAESPGEFGLARELATKAGFRTVLAVPLMRESKALGVIVLRRREVRPFIEK